MFNTKIPEVTTATFNVGIISCKLIIEQGKRNRFRINLEEASKRCSSDYNCKCNNNLIYTDNGYNNALQLMNNYKFGISKIGKNELSDLIYMTDGAEYVEYIDNERDRIVNQIKNDEALTNKEQIGRAHV